MLKLYTSLLLIFMLSPLHGQEDILETTGSLYEAKNYSELIQKAEHYLSNTSPDHFTTSFLQYDLANAYMKSSDFITCWKYIQEAYITAQKVELADSTDVRLYIDVAQRLGDYSFLAEEYNIGLNAMEKAITLGNERLSNDSWRMGKLYHKTGAIYRLITQFDKSIKHLEEGQKYLPNLPEAKGKYLGTVFLSEMAQVYNDQNQLSKSIEIFLKILKTAYEEDNKKRLSIYNNNIAIAYERKGDYGKAEYHLKKSLEAKFELYGEKTPKIISNYTNLARVNMLLSRYTVADEYYQKLDKLIGEVFEKDHVKNGDTQFNIGTGYFQQRLYSKALPHSREATRIWQLHKEENDLVLAESQYLLGATLSKLGKFDEALPILEKALQTRIAGIKTQDNERKKILTSLYETHAAIGNETLALDYLDQSFQALNYDVNQPYSFSNIENPLGLIEPLSLKLVYISKKISSSQNIELIEEGTAISLIADSLIQHIKMKYDDVSSRRIATSKIQDLNEALIQFNYIVYKKTDEKKYVENALKITEQSNNNFLYEAIAEENSSSELGLPIELLGKKSALQDSITIFHKKLESYPLDIRTQSKAYASDLGMLNMHKNELYSLIKNIEKDHPKYFESIYKLPKISLDQVQVQLKSNEVIISYFNGHYEVFGLLISAKSYQFITLGNSQKVELTVTEFLESLNSKSARSPYLNSSKMLHKLLIAPFNIPSNADISIIADDILSLLPFEIIIDERTNLPLCLTNVITYQYSNNLKINSTSGKKGKGSIAMAPIFKNKEQPLYAQNVNLDDRYRSEVSYLPETKEEVNSIYNLLKGEVFIGEQATETAFKKSAPNKGLLHLATHGFVDNENPDFSRLYFSTENDSLNDGLLHAHEIVNMNLSADLVTLSACNTGVGKIENGEGISSLGRAFAYANCPNQLISLWPANDKSTTQLMSYYYANLKKGMGKSTALTAAKRTYLTSAPEVFKHPYYWAGFVYYGQDSPLDIGNTIPIWIWGLGIFALLAFVFFNKEKLMSFF